MIHFFLESYKRAVDYLQKYLKLKWDNSFKNNNHSEYQYDNFGDDDRTFVESQAEIASEEDYKFEIDEPISPAENNKVSDKAKVPLNELNELHGTFEDTQNSILSPADEKNSNTIETDLVAGDGFVDEKPGQHPHQPSADDFKRKNWADYGSVEDEQTCLNKLFDIDDDQNEEIDDDQNEEILEEEKDEFSWYDFDGLGEFDELAHSDTEEEIQKNGKISREDRARQIAVDVLDKYGWDNKYLILLQQVFVENGWSAARVAIEREIDNNLQPEELALARKIRLFWSQNEQYWITFHKIKSNAPFQQAEAAYNNMSWLEALRIIRCFPTYPDIEEIYMYIDETYDYWYNNIGLHSRFKAFLKFLRYRTWMINCALSDYRTVFVVNPMDITIGDDYDKLDNPNIIERQKLLEIGIQLNRWPPSPKNKIKDFKEDTEPIESESNK